MIVNHLTKIVYYKPIKVLIDTLDIAEVIINIGVKDYGLPNFIVNN